MKRTIHWLYLGLIILALTAPIISNAASILVVQGLVTDAAGLPLDGLEVTVTNETKSLTLTPVSGDSGAGTYAATFIDLFGGSAADVADEMRVSVKQEGEVVAVKTYTIVQDDFDDTGQAGNVEISIQITAAPSLTGITPDNALAAGGTTVQIIGENLQEGASVTFGGSEATDVDVVSDAGISATIPAGSRGAVEVVVTNPNGQAATIEFTYIDFPGWDVDKNGTVNVFDLVGVAGQFAQTGPGLSGDVDGNEEVNIFDLVAVASHFGEDTVAAAPPHISLNPGEAWAVQPQPGGQSLDVDASVRLRTALTELERLSETNPPMLLAATLLRQWLVTAGEIPTDTTLLLNYPNPFNPETWIPYHLAKSTEVKIFIYNILGQPVRRLEIGHRHAGEYIERSQAVYWDGRNDTGELVTSGIYFYTIEAGDFTATRKMVIGK